MSVNIEGAIAKAKNATDSAGNPYVYVSPPLHEATPEELLNDAYWGEGGFLSGSYLVQHRRESGAKYSSRKTNAYYLNYLAPVVNSHVNPIFKTDALREYGDNALFSEFVEDVDMHGTTLDRFMKLFALNSKLKAVCFAVIDNLPEQPLNKKDAIEQRALPYVYLVKREDVIKYKLDKHKKLTMFSYRIIAGEFESGKKPAYNVMVWTRDEWYITNMKGEKTGSGGINPLGRLPIVPLYSRPTEPGIIMPAPEFLSIAKTNARIYNLCSEIDEILRNQAFAILTYPGSPNPVPKPGTTNNKQQQKQEMIIGTENVLGYAPESSNKPDFIAPPADPYNMLCQERVTLIQEIYRMAMLSHVTGVDSTGVKQAASGVSKQWDFETANTSIADFARNIESAEREIVDLFQLWAKEEFEYSTNYGDDFGLEDVMYELTKAMTALGLEIGPLFNNEVKRRAARLYLKDMPESEIKPILDDIEQAQKDADKMRQQEQQTWQEAIKQQKEAMQKEKDGAMANQGRGPEIKI